MYLFVRYPNQFTERLHAKLSADSVGTVLKLGQLHQSRTLKDACFTYIKRNAAQVLVLPDILAIGTEDPELWTELTTAVSGPRKGSSRQPTKIRPRAVRSTNLHLCIQ
jgi:hypothetical protein